MIYVEIRRLIIMVSIIIMMFFVEFDVVWEDWGCLMVLFDDEINVNIM